MDYYILKYFLVADYTERRTVYREEHLRIAGEMHSKGELLLGGAMSDPADEALLVFRVPDKSFVEEFVRKDPYILNGLVAHWEIRKWSVVIGK